MTTYLLMIGDKVALQWILRSRRMAFPPTREADALGLRVSDRLLLYTTRSAFHNPTRDRGRLIGSARVAEKPQLLSRPEVIAGREFTVSCAISLERLAPYRQGLELAPLIGDLELFPEPASWSARIRRTLVPLSRNDSALLHRKLKPLTQTPESSLPGYL